MARNKPGIFKPLAISAALACLPFAAQAALYISVIEGLGGLPEYQDQFDEQRQLAASASISMTDEDKVTVFTSDAATREALLLHFAELTERMTENDRAAIYLIGHGSFDGEEYKFNITGPDITGSDLKNVLDGLPGQNHFLVNTSSTSGAMLDTLIGEDAAQDPEAPNDSNYIVITATRNGTEKNATHFGDFFITALTSEEADVNKNSNVSIQEAFDFAERSVTDYFEQAGRLATEHPQLRGSGAAQFSLARVSTEELTSANPEVNDLLQQRLDIDAQIEELQLRRADYSNSEYIQLLQSLILESATITEQIELQRLEEAGGIE